jgi:hypothetical protein
VVRHVDGDVAFGGQVGQHLRHLVDDAVQVLFDRVRFHERIEHHKINLAPDDDVLDFSCQIPAHRPAGLVDCHQLAASPTRGGQEEPALEVRAVDIVMQSCRQDAPAQFSGIVFERDDLHATTLKHMLAGKFASARQRQCLCIAHRGFRRRHPRRANS